MQDPPMQYGDGHASSPGFGHSQISRQFTDAERSIDDRLESHLTAPPLQLHIGDNINQSYKWLSEDLALRSTLSNQLAKEQSMAYRQSERHELSNQAERQFENDQQVLKGLQRVHSRFAKESRKNPNYHFGDAVMAESIENPSLALMPEWNKATSAQDDLMLNDRQKDIRAMKEDIDFFGLGKMSMDNEAMYDVVRSNPDYMSKRTEMFSNQLDAEQATSSTASILADKAKIEGQIGLRRAEAMRDRFDAAFDADGGAEGIEFRAALLGIADELGIESPYFSQFASKYGKTEIIRNMATDANWLGRRLANPEEKEKLETAINVLGNPQSLDDAERAQAENVLLRLANRHKQDTAEDVRFKQEREAARDQLEAFAKRANTSMRSAHEDIFKLASSDDGFRNLEAIISTADAYIQSLYEQDTALAKEYREKVYDSMRGLKGGDDYDSMKHAAKLVRITSDFTRDLRAATLDESTPELRSAPKPSVGLTQSASEVKTIEGTTYELVGGTWYERE